MLRLITFNCVKKSYDRVGLLLDNNKVVDLTAASFKSLPALEGCTEDMLKFIGRGKHAIEEAKRIAKDPPADSILSKDEIVLKAPIPLPPRNLMCVGKNYIDHVNEVKSVLPTGTKNDNSGPPEAPKFPIFFTKAPDTVTKPFGFIDSHTKLTKALDYEAELAVVIGKCGKDIKPENAMEYVYGYTIANDVTARDLQRKHVQWFKGKTLDHSCPLGPCIVPACDLDPSDLSIKLWLNGEKKQDSRTSKMIFKIPELISQLSQGFTLKAGDIILTGTPDGVGYARTPPRTLLAGDHVVIEIEKVGVLESTVR